MKPYEEGQESASDKLGLTDDQIIALLHGAPIPLTSTAAMLYEAKHAPDDRYIARPLATGAGALLGGLGGAALMAGLGSGSAYSQSPKSKTFPLLVAGALGSGLGAYGARKAFDMATEGEDDVEE